MPDLLTHALIAYTLATLLSWQYEWLSPSYVTVAMAGAFVPDLAKVALIIPSTRVESVLHLPFDWFALHTLGGSLVSITIGVVLVTSEERRRVASLLGGCHRTVTTPKSRVNAEVVWTQRPCRMSLR